MTITIILPGRCSCTIWIFPCFHFAKCAGWNLKLHRPDLCLCLLSCHKCLTEAFLFSLLMTVVCGCVCVCVRAQDLVVSVSVHLKETIRPVWIRPEAISSHYRFYPPLSVPLTLSSPLSLLSPRLHSSWMFQPRQSPPVTPCPAQSSDHVLSKPNWNWKHIN